MKKLLTLLFAVAVALSLTTSTFAQDTAKKDDTKKEEKKEKKAKKEKKEKKDDKMKDDKKGHEGRQEIACVQRLHRAPAALAGALFLQENGSPILINRKLLLLPSRTPYKDLTSAPAGTVVKSRLTTTCPVAGVG